MKDPCPHCGYQASGSKKEPNAMTRRVFSTRRRAFWDALTEKTVEIRARGVKIELDELTSHRKRAPITRLFHLYNAERTKIGLPTLKFLDFDPWGPHKDAQELVADAFSDNPRDIAAAKRLFKVNISDLQAVVT